MNRRAFSTPQPFAGRLLAASLLTVAWLCGCSSGDPNGDVVSELEAMGAKVKVESGSYSVDVRNSPNFTDAELETLARLPNVTDLTLQNVPVTDAGLARLQPLTRVNRLILNESDVTGKGLQELAKLPLRRTLSNIGLRSTRVTDTDLKTLTEFPKLSRIDLSGTPVTDAGLAHLSRLPLSMVNVKETKVSEAGAEKLKEANPKLDIQR